MKYDSLSPEDWRLVETQIAAFQKTTAFRVIMTLMRERLSSTEFTLFSPDTEDPKIRIAQGEHKGLNYGIMVYEDAANLCSRASKRRKS